jgi:ribosomal protein L29
MKLAELEKLDSKSLKERLKNIGIELTLTNTKKSVSGIEKPHMINDLRKERAVINTLLNNR